MMCEPYEQADFESDPLAKMLRDEGDADEADALESLYRSAQYKARTSEKDPFH